MNYTELSCSSILHQMGVGSLQFSPSFMISSTKRRPPFSYRGLCFITPPECCSLFRFVCSGVARLKFSLCVGAVPLHKLYRCCTYRVGNCGAWVVNVFFRRPYGFKFDPFRFIGRPSVATYEVVSAFSYGPGLVTGGGPVGLARCHAPCSGVLSGASPSFGAARCSEWPLPPLSNSLQGSVVVTRSPAAKFSFLVRVVLTPSYFVL